MCVRLATMFPMFDVSMIIFPLTMADTKLSSCGILMASLKVKFSLMECYLSSSEAWVT